MTALSWIFGGKKKEDKPIPVTVEAVEVGSDEDYTIIQAHATRMGIYPQIPPSPYTPSQSYAPLPYPMLPRQGQQQSVNNSVKPSVQNQLEGVPFVLSPALNQGSSQEHQAGIEDMRRAIFQITADINDSFFDYDFKMEHSILQEASMYSPEK